MPCRRFGNRGCLVAIIAIGASTAADAHAADPDVRPKPAPARTAPASDPLAETARQLFDEGVQLANAGRFDAARAAFRGAYELQPHPSVLYNIAQCEVRLGDTASAVATLERFLESGGAGIAEEQRRAVEKQLAELRAELAATTREPAGGVPAVISPEDGNGAPAAPSPRADGSASVPASPEPLELRFPAPAPLPLAAVPAPERQLRPFVLGGIGLGLLGTAAALYLWNDGRHEAWRDDRAQLAGIPGFRTQLARDPELWRRAEASNRRLGSIHAVDVVTLIAATAGAAALGIAAWDFFTPSDGSERQPASTSGELAAGLAPRLYWQGRW